MNKQIYQEIISKKEFSQLPKKDVELAFAQFEKRQTSDEEKVRLTRDLLRKVFSMFTSGKLLSPKNKSVEWILRKHISTRERFPYYNELYKKIFRGFSGKVSVIDLGCGINGFSYGYFKNRKFNYVGVEAMGQLVELMNNYFEKEKISGKVIHLSLLELEKIKKIIKMQEKPRIVFLFKVIDSLELLERHSSKRLIEETVSLADKVVVSFATRSLIKREKLKYKRNWIVNFIKYNFKILDDFEFGGERYLVLSK